MSSSMTVGYEFEPGIIYAPRIGQNGKETRIAGGVDYDHALLILDSEPPNHSGLVGYENGAIDIPKTETLDIFGGQAYLTSRDDIPAGSVCYQLVDDTVADASRWRWVKVVVHGGPFDGFCGLGVDTETKEAVVVLLQ